jgi:hypothetical protein
MYMPQLETHFPGLETLPENMYSFRREMGFLTYIIAIYCL